MGQRAGPTEGRAAGSSRVAIALTSTKSASHWSRETTESGHVSAPGMGRCLGRRRSGGCGVHEQTSTHLRDNLGHVRRLERLHHGRRSHTARRGVSDRRAAAARAKAACVRAARSVRKCAPSQCPWAGSRRGSACTAQERQQESKRSCVSRGWRRASSPAGATEWRKSGVAHRRLRRVCLVSNLNDLLEDGRLDVQQRNIIGVLV